MTSGKGGVGKSSMTLGLAAAMAQDNLTVGILDADINGPSIAKMAGVKGHQLRQSPTGMLPAINGANLRIMSMDLFLPDDDSPVLWQAPTQKDAFTWRAMMEMAALRDLLTDTEWGDLDMLLIDLPPGTDKLPNLADVLPRLSGAVVVTIPSAAARHIVDKSIRMARELLKAPVIGMIENMSAHVCSACGHEEPLFPPEHPEDQADPAVPLLGRVPFDARMSAAADRGGSFLAGFPTSPAAGAIRDIAHMITKQLSGERRVSG